jgi:hypothetical protein
VPFYEIRGCIQKFSDWPPGARTANGTALCHYMQLYRYFVSQFSEFCRHNPLCCFSTSVCCCKRIFRYRLSPETYGYTVIYVGYMKSILVQYKLHGEYHFVCLCQSELFCWNSKRYLNIKVSLCFN